MLISSLNDPLARTIVTSGPMARRDGLGPARALDRRHGPRRLHRRWAQGPTLATTTSAGGAPGTFRSRSGSRMAPGRFPPSSSCDDCSGLGRARAGRPAAGRRSSSGAAGRRADECRTASTRGSRRRVHESFAAPQRRRARRVGCATRTRRWLNLRTLPFVDGSRVGLMGGSHGEATTLAAMVAPSASPGFRAGVALYPGCAQWLRSWRHDVPARRPAADPDSARRDDLDAGGALPRDWPKPRSTGRPGDDQAFIPGLSFVRQRRPGRAMWRRGSTRTRRPATGATDRRGS